ncbi:secreted lyase (plasmid) [Rhizobium tropici CIAT 899]|nr:secreted lyase [Rhizobium tropici CIAT 899]
MESGKPLSTPLSAWLGHILLIARREWPVSDFPEIPNLLALASARGHPAPPPVAHHILYLIIQIVRQIAYRRIGQRLGRKTRPGDRAGGRTG